MLSVILACAGASQLSSDILSYVSLAAELGRGYQCLLAIQLHPGTSQPAFTGAHNLFLEGCLQFTSSSMIKRLLTLLVLLRSYCEALC